MTQNDHIGIVSSSMTYSKVMRLIGDRYQVTPERLPGMPLAESVIRLVGRAVRENCRRTIEETAFRCFGLAAEQYHSITTKDFFIPASEIYINTVGLGHIRLRSFLIQSPVSHLRFSA
jgi:hypothetical protein